jgi:DNA-binding YbaB/EbfC family protein
MAKGARKNAQFKALSTAPTFNKTPIGSATPPLPYPVTEDLANSAGAVSSVQFNGDAAYVLKQSSQPSCKGDAAGSAKGVKSSTTSGEVKPVAGAATVRVNKQPVIRDGDPCTLNGGNCPGIYQSQPAGSGKSPDNPIPSKLHPQTEPEQGFWSKASPWVHGALGVASFVPGLSIVTGAADAAIYAAEGEVVEAGLAAASMIPGGKIATTAGKAGRAGLKMIRGAEDAAKVAREAKAAQEAAQNIQQQMEQAQATLDIIQVEGVSGGGLVKVRATAKGRILNVALDDSLIVPADKGMLEDLITAAFNDAREKADAASNAEMSKMSSGLPLPPGFKLPF